VLYGDKQKIQKVGWGTRKEHMEEIGVQQNITLK
jgi:hypothetical protein